ncbi:hypothetical protein Amet_1492 [Alkaliphilus metalliredigens QYMF]|uniref:Uncharacterized protein n=1 Tax=Alkaliphilus metalliredigens (strain QYMF) TaxID=293826 RepID=A6TNC0_ALKMQ|nr:YcdB/YcdC domain-containing protein [Alkaliphilus metalliredigens]ABR47688.1 hypothetical protein Amet_1492 [Alkaliphilus metalliredigens QYMF]
MKFRKTISFIMVGGLLFSGGTVAFGQGTNASITMSVERAVSHPGAENTTTDSNLSESQALELAKEYMESFYGENMEKEEFDTQASYRENWQNPEEYTWEIAFSRHSRDSYFHANVTIRDIDEKLMSIRKHSDYRGEAVQIAKYTKEEAEKIAYNFIKDFKPDSMEQLIVGTSPHMRYYDHVNSSGLNPREYHIFYTRQENDIPVVGDGIQIGVNNATGEVTSYSYNWNEKELPAADATISAEEARGMFKEKLDFQLNYISVRDRSEPYGEEIEKVRLTYSPSFNGGSLIDATTGQMIDPVVTTKDKSKTVDISEKQRKQFGKLTSKTEQRTSEMTREEAVSLANQIFEEIYDGQEINIERTSYNSSMNYGQGGNRKTWDIQFGVKDQYRLSGNVAIDALTGEVMRLNLHSWGIRERAMESGEEFTPEVEWEDAYDIAIEVVKTLFPEKLKDLDYEQTYHEQIHYYNDMKIINPEYSFNFERVENHIPYRDNSINVSIDSSTGMLQRVFYRWNDVQLPETQKILDKQDLMDVYMQQSKAELSYSTIRDREANGQDIKLVYVNSPNNSVIHQNIDAHTGMLLDWNGQEVDKEDGEIQDITKKIQGHWAEKELKIMVANGVIDLEKFDVGDKMTKNEIIKMMVKAVGYEMYGGQNLEELKFIDVDSKDDYYNYLQAATMYQFIENEQKIFDGYNTVSRENLAEMLIKMTTLEKAATIEGIYTLPVEDIEAIDKEKIGHIAILHGLEIMKSEGERYNPQEAVTLEEAAVSIYRAFEIFGRQMN